MAWTKVGLLQGVARRHEDGCLSYLSQVFMMTLEKFQA